jgi:enoyl-CoA hydratase/carnithine racemase
MSEGALLRRREDGWQVWTLNRPDTRNALTDEVVDALVEAVADVNADHSVRAVVLTGAGRAFSSGGNVKDMRARRGMFAGTPAELRQGYRHGIQRMTVAMDACEVPIIAAVNGPAVGAGCDLAMMCDVRVASPGATFAESFVKVGLIPGDGGAWFLPRVVGPSRAAEMAFTGDAVDADTALAWGITSRVVADGELVAAAEDLARRIAANPPHVLRMTKQLMRQGRQQPLADHLDLAAAMQALAHHTADHGEAVEAMLAKRPPHFSGE